MQLDPDQIEAAIRFWQKQEQEADIAWQETLRLELGAANSIDGLPIQGVEYEGWPADWMERFKGDQKLEVLPQPDGLQGALRPYQQYGYYWLVHLGVSNRIDKPHPSTGSGYAISHPELVEGCSQLPTYLRRNVLDFMRPWQMEACLADAMGLGKTIQTIALLQREKEAAGRLPGLSSHC